MAGTVEELTINFQDENGVLLVKELDKEVLTKGTWSTLMFKYQDLDKASGQFKTPKYAIRRYQKQNGEYRVKSKFTISSPAQAQKICEILTRWSAGDAGNASGSESED
jgi:hypothetical protein